MYVFSQAFHTDRVREAFLENAGGAGNRLEIEARPEVSSLFLGVV